MAELENGEICALRQQNEELEKRRAFELAEMNKKMADLQNGELCALRQQNAELAESKAREVAQLSKQIADLQDAMKSRPAAPSTPRVSARDESTAAAAAPPRTPRTPKQGSQQQDAVQTPVIRRASSLKDIRTPKQAVTPTPAFMVRVLCDIMLLCVVRLIAMSESFVLFNILYNLGCVTSEQEIFDMFPMSVIVA